MIQVLRLADLFVANTIWRITGSLRAGQRILTALAADQASVRSVASILLIRGGNLAFPLLAHALQQRIVLPQALILAGAVGAEPLAQQLESYCNDSDPTVAAAAREGMRRLQARREALSDRNQTR